MAELDLQVQTDKYCIYWVRFLSFCFTPDPPPQLQLEDVVELGGRAGGSFLPPKASLQGWGEVGPLARRRGGAAQGEKGLGAGQRFDPEPGGRQPAGEVGRGQSGCRQGGRPTGRPHGSRVHAWRLGGWPVAQ